jgi:hypothetical protein
MAGWKYDDEGYLSKGNTKVRVANLTGMPGWDWCDPGYDPHKHAFAARLGGTYLGPNCYRLGTLLVDRHGACLDPRTCPECGGVDGERKFRKSVPMTLGDVVQGKQRYTYCRRCCTADDLRAIGVEPPLYHD